MSRVGNAIITVPTGAEIVIDGNQVRVKGSKGELTMETRPEVKVEVADNQVTVKRKKDDRNSRALINNMVVGVTNGWTKNLEMVGVGYRAQGGGDQVTLNVGYSHPVVFKAPAGITIAVADNTKISVSGIDRAIVGQVAANIRKVRPPEVYKGKGIRYVGEYVRRKAGKAGKGAAK